MTVLFPIYSIDRGGGEKAVFRVISGSFYHSPTFAKVPHICIITLSFREGEYNKKRG
ncbi:hypothetical protein BMETH_795_0 [methanotrophic bacterial endosymbiont of Bathymodiolus sp.]|nr:hypothetical protein BMETH_795_0 [methanotrophic bacterial endosymbiont of Bathymodiolus sp.]